MPDVKLQFLTKRDEAKAGQAAAPVAAPMSAVPEAPAPASAPVAAPAVRAPVAEPAMLDPRAILNSIGNVIYDWDILTDKLSWGPNLTDVLGLEGCDQFVSGVAYANCVAAGSESTRFEAIMGCSGTDSGSGVTYRVQYGLTMDRRNAPVWVEDTGRWFAGPDRRPARAHGIIRVITDRYVAEKEMAFQSQFDPLTGTLNRTRLIEQVNTMIGLATRQQTHFCVMLAGIDNLFLLNRNYGYDVADEVIAGVAARVRASIRANDLIARYAGNKFALVLEECDTEQMRAAALRLLDIVALEPFDTSAGPVQASLRMGGTIAPRQGRSAQVLLQHAEEALDLARKPVGEKFVGYEPSLVRADARMTTLLMSDEIVSALNQGRIHMAFQPIVASATGQLAFHEGLMRLQREDGSIVSPTTILPVAEKAGLVHLIDRRMLEIALERLNRDPNLHLTVNASGATVHDPRWPDYLHAACAVYPHVVSRLIIEITETCAIEDIEATRRTVAAIKACGLRVAMDDFGAGHTSFKNLRNLDIDLIKIDGAFMQNLPDSADDRFFVKTLVDLAKHLNIPIVAEWVENAETARILTDWGVDYMQGHLFGRAEIEPIADIRMAAAG